MSARRTAAVVVSLAMVAVLGSVGDGRSGASPSPPAAPTFDDADRCDVLDSRHCLLPFPSDVFTVPDPATDTGRRVAFDAASMISNSDGVTINPGQWNKNDGFSPGSAPVVHLPEVDLAASGAAPIGDIGRSLEPDGPVLLIDADTGERHPHWVEQDAHADDDADRLLVVQPAVNLAEGHRYIVAMRDLVDGGGDPIAPFPGFEVFRDDIPTTDPDVEARRPAMANVLSTLSGLGVDTSELVIAWDFTVASERGLSERLLHIRDDAFAGLDGAAPSFSITSVETDPTPEVARRVTGTFEVPSYLTGDGSAGNGFAYGPGGLPQRSGVDWTAPFVCNIPHAALASPPARPSLYGHGLLGSHAEVDASDVRAFADEHNIVFCATDWIGMAEEDLFNAFAILRNMSKMWTLADRSQQGILNTLFLGRLLVHPDGFASDPAFQAAGGDPLVDGRRLFFDGNSQGAILGGAATAVAQDWRDAVLGVPGMNYSLLIPRSRDFIPFLGLFSSFYPNQLEQGLVLALAQMLWDRGETNGYAHHLTDDPLPGTPGHRVLLHAAFGDQQVTTYAAEVEARTIGAAMATPGLAPNRSPDADPFWGIEPIEQYPHVGSAYVLWDSGAAPPPTENLPPLVGFDPHGDPRSDPDARTQKSRFLQIYGWLVDVCDAGPCVADGS